MVSLSRNLQRNLISFSPGCGNRRFLLSYAFSTLRQSPMPKSPTAQTVSRPPKNAVKSATNFPVLSYLYWGT